MGITDEISEIEDGLQGLDKLLVQTSKDALMLKSSLKGVNAFVGGKNYEIISRFLSGTGAWKVLNKAKATVLTMIQLVSVQERAALADATRMKEMASIIKDRKKLLALESDLKKAQVSMDKEQIELLKEKSDIFAAASYAVGDEKAIEKLLKMVKKQKGIVGSILGGASKSSKTSTANKMLQDNKGILESNVLQAALLGGGFALNNKNLKNIMGSQNHMTNMLKEQTKKYAELEHEGLKKYDEMLKNFNYMDVTGEKKEPESKEDFMKQYFKDESYHLKYGEKPTKESVEKDFAKLAEELQGSSFRLKDIFKGGKLRNLVKSNINPDISAMKSRQEELKNMKNMPTMRALGIGEDSFKKKAYKSGPDMRFKESKDWAKLSHKMQEKRDKRTERYHALTGNIFKKGEEKQNQFLKEIEHLTLILEDPINKMLIKIKENGGFAKSIQDWVEEKAVKLVEFTGKLLSFAKKTFIYFGTLLITFFLLYRLFKNQGFRERLDEIRESAETFFYTYLLPLLTLVWGGLEKIYNGFKQGELWMVLEGLGQIIIGLIGVSFAILGKALHILGQVIWAAIETYIEWFWTNIQENTSKAISSLFYIAGALTLLVAFFLGGWAIALAGVIMIGIGYMIDRFGEKLGPLKFWAKGGTTHDGLSVVGEEGPELVRLPVGSRVHSNADSRKMLGGSTINNITIQVSGRVGASDSEIKDIANKLSRELTNRMNRTIMALP